MGNNFTPGPLTFHIGNVWVEGLTENYVISAAGIEVAWLVQEDLAQQKAYAELFAEAPDTLRQRDALLEALREIASYPALSPLDPLAALDDMRQIARAAIAAATKEAE